MKLSQEKTFGYHRRFMQLVIYGLKIRKIHVKNKQYIKNTSNTIKDILLTCFLFPFKFFQQQFDLMSTSSNEFYSFYFIIGCH